MSTYIIGPCFLKRAKQKIYFSEILLKFIHSNPLKLGIDDQNIILNEYHEIAKQDQCIASWLQLMSTLKPLSFEKISIGPFTQNGKSLDVYIATCSCVIGCKKMIVFTFQSLDGYEIVEGTKLKVDDECLIEILDRDTAIKDVAEDENSGKGVVYNIKDSIVATKNSSITDSSIRKQ